MRVFLLLIIISQGAQGICQVLERLTFGRIVANRSDSRSVNIIDVNNDGYQDVFISNGPRDGQNDQLYINDGAGVFSQLIDMEITNDNEASVGATFADFDNDGQIDGYVTTWYGRANSLYRNTGSNTFELVNNGLSSNLTFSESASWGDFNNDGLVDLFVTNSEGGKRNQLFRNMGSGVFEAAQSQLLVTEQKASRCVNWVDFNNDGLVDIYVSNELNSNDLFENTGNGRFEKISGSGANGGGTSTLSSSWADIDNDGDFDLFLANSLFYQEQNNQLYRNENGVFTAITMGDAPRDGGCSYGSSFGDMDNDGDVDLFVTNGFCNSNLGNFYYENDGSGVFTNRSELLVDGRQVCSFGVAWGDLNEDGFLDAVVANCKNNQSSNEQSNSVFFNSGNENNWYKINLIGRVSNRSAIGAVVRLKSNIDGHAIWQTRMVSAQSGYSGQNSLEVHFGLKTATIVDSIVVEWPSGEKSTITNSQVNQSKEITEGLITNTTEISLGQHGASMSIFPNPINIDSGYINIALDIVEKSSMRDLRISILNVSGVEVVNQSIDVKYGYQALTLKLPKSIEKGIYFIKIYNREYSIDQKLIVD